MKYKILTLLFMYALHIFADFHLQSILTNLKQKKWWDEQLISVKDSDKKLYKRDYLVGLIVHSFEWTFCFMLPIFFTEASIVYILVAFILNTTIHAVVDNLKCNSLAISLMQDQILHIIQILITWIIFFLL